MFSTLQFKKRQHLNYRCKFKGIRCNSGKNKKMEISYPIDFASRFFSNTEKYPINENELFAVVWGLNHFHLHIYGKPIELVTDHQSLEPLIERNRSYKTCSARSTRWLEKLTHFDIQTKHVAGGKHLSLTDCLGRNPIASPVPIENYDKEYVINCVTSLLEFIGCITDDRKPMTRTDQTAILHHANNQSEARLVQKLETSDNEQSNHSSILSTQSSVRI